LNRWLSKWEPADPPAMAAAARMKANDGKFLVLLKLPSNLEVPKRKLRVLLELLKHAFDAREKRLGAR
jgi:hypothetical protein